MPRITGAVERLNRRLPPRVTSRGTVPIYLIVVAIPLLVMGMGFGFQIPTGGLQFAGVARRA